MDFENIDIKKMSEDELKNNIVDLVANLEIFDANFCRLKAVASVLSREDRNPFTHAESFRAKRYSQGFDPWRGWKILSDGGKIKEDYLEPCGTYKDAENYGIIYSMVQGGDFDIP